MSAVIAARSPWQAPRNPGDVDAFARLVRVQCLLHRLIGTNALQDTVGTDAADHFLMSEGGGAELARELEFVEDGRAKPLSVRALTRPDPRLCRLCIVSN